MLVCVAVSECVGIVLEVAQHYIPGRSTDVYDVVANTVGVLVGVGCGMWVVGSFLKTKAQARSLR
jgi:VanZ family protein